MYDMYQWSEAGTGRDDVSQDESRGSGSLSEAPRARLGGTPPADEAPDEAEQAVQASLDRRDNGGDAASLWRQ